MEIYLIRHTQVGVEPGICYGQTDVPLAESFREEFEDVRQKLPQIVGVTMYSSPLSRCRLLAEWLNSGDVECDERLMELNFGEWEQRRWDDIGAGELKVWTEDFVDQPCPDGESYREQFHRAVAFWDELYHRSHDVVFIITHAGFIRALLAHLLGLPLEKSLRIGLDFGGVIKIHMIEDVPIIDYINR